MNTQTPEEIQNKPFFYKPFFIAPKSNIFAERAIRFDELATADTSGWRDYLALLATLSRAQNSALNQVDNSQTPHFGTTRLPESNGAYIPDVFLAYLSFLINELRDKVNPTIQAALNDLAVRSSDDLHDMAGRILRDEVPENEQIFRIWLYAALQCAWTAWAMQLTDDDVSEQEKRSHCPCCGMDAVASMVLNGGDWHGLRYQHCALCNSRWNALRAKCTFCDDQSAISHEKVEDDGLPEVYRGAHAECCGKCGHYRKLFLLSEQQYADPLADDLASLILDELVGEKGILRGGYNPFLMV